MSLIIDRLAYGIGYDTTGLVQGERVAGASLGRLTGFLKSPLGIAFQIGSALGVIGVQSFQTAKKWESSWAEVRTILSGTDAQLQVLEKRVRGLSSIIPQDESLLAKGYYQAVSAGITDTNEALQVTKIAAKAAVGGITDTFTSVDAITTIINAYGLEVSEASRISDLLFTTVREGKTQFPELAGNIGKVVPFAANAQIGLEELFAAIATLTKGGIETSVATTALRDALVKVIKPTEKAKETAAELGLEFNAQALASKGLIPFLAEISEKTKGNSEAVGRLFEDVQGMTAVLALAGKQSGEFARQVDIMTNDSLGAANAAFQIMNDTLENRQARNMNKLKLQLSGIGDALLGVARAGAAGMGSLFPESTEEKIERAARLRGQIDNLDKALGPLIDRYEELTSKQSLSADEAAELEDVTRALARAFPEAISGVNELTGALELNIKRMQELRGEQIQFLNADARKTFKGLAREFIGDSREIARAEDGIRRVLALLERFDRGETIMGSRGGFPAAMSRAEIEQGLAVWQPVLERAKEDIKASTDALVEFIQTFDLDEAILEWGRLQDAIEAGDISIERARAESEEAHRAFRVLFGTTDVTKYRDLLDAVVERMRAMNVETQATVSRPPESAPVAVAAATALDRLKAFVEQEQAAELRDLARFIGREFGVALTDGEIEQLRDKMPDVMAHFERLYEDEKRRAAEAGKAAGQAFARAWEAAARGEGGFDPVFAFPRLDRTTGGVSAPFPVTDRPSLDDFERIQRAREEEAEAMRKARDETDRVADTLIELAQVSGGAGPKIAALIAGIAKLSNLSGSTVNAALGAAGALAGFVGAIFGAGEASVSAAEKLRETRDALSSIPDAGSTPGRDLNALIGGLADFQDQLRQVQQTRDPIQRLQALQRFMNQFRDFLEAAGIDVPDNLESFSLVELVRLISDLLQGAREELYDFAQFATDTFSGALEALRYEFDLFDIDDPIQQLRRLLEVIDQFAGANLSDFADSPEKLERIVELIGGLLTGILPGFGSAGGEGLTQTPFMAELMELLGISFDELVALLKRFVENGLTGDDLQDLIGELEGLLDDVVSSGQDAGDTARSDIETVSRSISITEEQGRSLISLQATGLELARRSATALDAIEAHTAGMLAALRDAMGGVSINGSGETNIYLDGITVTVPGTVDRDTVKQAVTEGVRAGTSLALRAAGAPPRITRRGL